MAWRRIARPSRPTFGLTAGAGAMRLASAIGRRCGVDGRRPAVAADLRLDGRGGAGSTASATGRRSGVEAHRPTVAAGPRPDGRGGGGERGLATGRRCGDAVGGTSGISGFHDGISSRCGCLRWAVAAGAASPAHATLDPSGLTHRAWPIGRPGKRTTMIRPRRRRLFRQSRSRVLGGYRRVAVRRRKSDSDLTAGRTRL